MHRLFIVKPANRSLILKEVTGARVQQGVAGGITLLLIKLTGQFSERRNGNFIIVLLLYY
jgi:hypothetical protein